MEISSLTKAFFVIVAITAALFLGKKLIGSGHSGGSGFIKENRVAVETALQNNIDVSRTGCVLEGPFEADAPGDPMIYRADKARSFLRSGCDKCADLVAAGLVKIEKEEIKSESGAVSERKVPTLTPLGKALYKNEVEDADYKRMKPRLNDDGSKRKLYEPRFCFGRAKFEKITESLSPFNIGGNKNVSVKYTATLEDAHPSLYTPEVQAQVKALKLDIPPKPEAGKTPTYAPRIGNLVIYPDGPEVDNSFRYGAWVNQ
jgi:hypothetical protein